MQSTGALSEASPSIWAGMKSRSGLVFTPMIKFTCNGMVVRLNALNVKKGVCSKPIKVPFATT